MEKTNDDEGKMQCLEDIKEDPLVEYVQHPCTKDCELEDNEVDFPLCEQDDYASLCVIRDTNHLKDEDIHDDLMTILCQETQVTINHIS